MRRLSLPVLGLFLSLSWGGGGLAQDRLPPGGAEAPDRWSVGPIVHRVLLELGTSEMASLADQPREYVRARVRADDVDLGVVGVHLKGSTGSFRPLSDKPSWTVDLSRFGGSAEFLGGKKWHLNNSVEDPSYVSEALGAAVFRELGIPAARVGHARVFLNGRELGLYVVKEGFAAALVEDQLAGPPARIFEPVTGSGEPPRLRVVFERNAPDTWPEISSLATILSEPDPAKRWAQLENVVELDSFIRFLAVEVILGHRDGYALAGNNYRVVQHSESGKFQWLPHGMDQLFRPPTLPGTPNMAGPLARAVMSVPEGKRRYAAALAELYPARIDPARLTETARTLSARMKPFLSLQEWSGIEAATEDLCERMQRRSRLLERERTSKASMKLEFSDGVARLDRWEPRDPPEQGSLESHLDSELGKSVLHVRAGPKTVSSWRMAVSLPVGRYRFEGRARTEGLEPLPFGKHQGARLRVAENSEASTAVSANTDWTSLGVEFRVEEGQEQRELICEVRASRGEAWFDQASLQIRRVE